MRATIYQYGSIQNRNQEGKDWDINFHAVCALSLLRTYLLT